jgi:hypothetical protein
VEIFYVMSVKHRYGESVLQRAVEVEPGTTRQQVYVMALEQVKQGIIADGVPALDLRPVFFMVELNELPVTAERTVA